MTVLESLRFLFFPVAFMVGILWFARFSEKHDPWVTFAEKHDLRYFPLRVSDSNPRPPIASGRLQMGSLSREVRIRKEVNTSTSNHLGLALCLEHPVWEGVSVRSARLPVLRDPKKEEEPGLGARVESGEEGFDHLFEVYSAGGSAAIEEHLASAEVRRGLQLLTALALSFEITDGKLLSIFPDAPTKREALEFRMLELFRFIERFDGVPEDGARREVVLDLEGDEGEEAVEVSREAWELSDVNEW